jgi:hypothetical protein
MKSLLKILFQVCLLSAVLTFAITHVFQYIMLRNEQIQGIYRRDYWPLFTEWLCTFMSLFISLAALTILLNKISFIRNNKFYSFCSFYFLLTLNAVIVFFLYVKEDIEHGGLKYFMAIILPIYLLVTIKFIRFRKSNTEIK